MTAPTVHRLPVRVRYPETDPMGRLHHSVYLVYFEMGRTELLRERGLAYAAMEAAGRFLAIAEVRVRYRAAARYDEELVVETWVERVRGARVVFGNRVVRPAAAAADASGADGTTGSGDGAAGPAVLAEATVTGGLVDAAGRPRRFTPEERRCLEPGAGIP